MLKYIIPVLAWLAWLATPAPAGELVIYYDRAYQPFCYHENGQAKGPYLEMAKEILAAMPEYDIKLTPIPWDRGKKIMREGRGFALIPPFFHAHDWPYLYPYSQPYYTEEIVVACRRGKLQRPRPNWPDDYLDLRIGNVRGYDGWGGDEIRRLAAEGKVHYEVSISQQASLVKLLKGKVDCVIVEKSILATGLDSLLSHKEIFPSQKEQIAIGAIISRDDIHIGYSRKFLLDGDTAGLLEIIQRIDAELAELKRSGRLGEIFKGYHRQAPEPKQK